MIVKLRVISHVKHQTSNLRDESESVDPPQVRVKSDYLVEVLKCSKHQKLRAMFGGSTKHNRKQKFRVLNCGSTKGKGNQKFRIYMKGSTNKYSQKKLCFSGVQSCSAVVQL